MATSLACPQSRVLCKSHIGEVFRSGCTFTRGYGKIFYFQPGHESFPTFYQAPVQSIIKNAVRFVAPACRIETTCPHVRNIHDDEPYVE